jgi:hypothetical protein
VHAPHPYSDHSRAPRLQREVAGDLITFRKVMRDMTEERSTGYRVPAISTDRSSVEAGKAVETARQNAIEAREGIARLERGEDFAGVTTKVRSAEVLPRCGSQ